MKRFTVNLNSIDAVKETCMKMRNVDFKVTLESEHYRVNGASVLGVFSLDLSKPVDVVVDAKYEKEAMVIYGDYLV